MNSITTKDYKYIIFILVLLMVGIFTFYYGKSGNDVVSYLGFAGTISSILISVVALLYTFYQSSTSISHEAKLNESSARLVNAVDQFQDIQSNLSASIEHIGFLSQQVAAVDNKIESLGNTLLTLPQSMTGTTFVHSKDDFIKVLRSTSIHGLLIIALCLYQSEKPKKVTFQQLVENYGIISPSSFTYDYAYGYAVAWSSFGIMNLSAANNEVIINFKNKEILLEALRIEMIERTNNTDFKTYFINSNAALRVYFDNFDLNLLNVNE